MKTKFMFEDLQKLLDATNVDTSTLDAELKALLLHWEKKGYIRLPRTDIPLMDMWAAFNRNHRGILAAWPTADITCHRYSILKHHQCWDIRHIQVPEDLYWALLMHGTDEQIYMSDHAAWLDVINLGRVYVPVKFGGIENDKRT